MATVRGVEYLVESDIYRLSAFASSKQMGMREQKGNDN